MKITGMLRVKNEARWIERVVLALFPLCDSVVILDDHSTDQTPDICRQIDRVTVIDSPFDGIDESRDKNFLLEQIAPLQPDWVLLVDGDEMLESSSAKLVTESVISGRTLSYSLRIVYLWDREDQVRTDGIYGNFYRPSLFKFAPSQRFRTTTFGGNFHCSSVPEELLATRGRCPARLLHFGYLHQADRLKKFDWYNKIDPDNRVEDGYRHMIAGDPGGPSPAEQTKHAGPLQLRPLVAVGY